MAAERARRVGVMGGTFNPIHHGHLVAAEESRHALSLDEVIFVPAGRPWQKEASELAPRDHRYAMTMLATQRNPHFRVSRLELDRDGPTYTIDTVRALKEKIPGAELFFILGADAILEIETWREPEALLREVRFVAVTRPGYDLERLEKEVPDGLEDRVTVLEIPALEISSEDVRARVRDGRPYRYLVPEDVAEYIEKVGLYGGRHG